MTFPPEVPPEWSTRAGSSGAASHRRRCRLVVIACLVLVGFLTACGSDGDDDTSSTTSTPPEVTTTVDDRDANTGDDDPDDPDDPRTSTTVVDSRSSDPDPEPQPGQDPDRELTDFEQGYVADLTANMGEMGFPPSVDGGCVAHVWVATIGGDRLQSSGLSAEEFVRQGPGDVDLDRATAEEMHRGGLDCGLDNEALMAFELETNPDSECSVDAISPELFEEAMVSAYLGDLDSAAMEQANEIMSDCRMAAGP